MLMHSACRLCLPCCVICCLASCGPAHGPPKIQKVAVVSVGGEVLVDGKPEAGVKIKAIPQTEFPAKEFENSLRGATDANGKFKMGTYESGDGLPVGEYALTFKWEPMRLKSGQSNAMGNASDKLKGKYETVEKSPKKFTVEKGKPVDLGKIELTIE